MSAANAREFLCLYVRPGPDAPAVFNVVSALQPSSSLCFPSLHEYDRDHPSRQVVEISKGSKVKYELDKKTGLIKVSHLTSVTIRKHTHCFISDLLSGGSRALLVGGVPAQLRLHPANALRGQRPHGRTGPHAGVCVPCTVSFS
jgi:hypothetical protein